MNDEQDWTLFAAAWLARSGDPRKHNEDDSTYATRQTDMAGAVATRMLQIKRVKMGRAGSLVGEAMAASEGPPMPQMRPATRRAINQALEEAGLVPSGGDGLPPPLNGPSAGQMVPHAPHAGGACQRTFGNVPRGTGQDCPGSYDEQGVCTVCRLPAVTPAERAAQAKLQGGA